MVDIVIDVDGFDNHFTYSVNSDQAGFKLDSYEDITYNAGTGTLLNILNSNRCSTNATSSIIRLNPTGISLVGATTLRRGYAGTASNPSNRTGGNVSRNFEVILCPSKKYLIRITNLSSSNNDIQVTFSYYETP
jgi:hypothetical protein